MKELELKVEELEAWIAPNLMTITPPAGESGVITVPADLPEAAEAANANADGVEVGG